MIQYIARADCPKCLGTSIVLSKGVRTADGQAYRFTASMPCDCVRVVFVEPPPDFPSPRAA